MSSTSHWLPVDDRSLWPPDALGCADYPAGTVLVAGGQGRQGVLEVAIRVLDTLGTPRPQAAVMLRPIAASSTTHVGRTDHLGRVVFTGLPRESFSLAVAHEAAAPARFSIKVQLAGDEQEVREPAGVRRYSNADSTLTVTVGTTRSAQGQVATIEARTPREEWRHQVVLVDLGRNGRWLIPLAGKGASLTGEISVPVSTNGREPEPDHGGAARSIEMQLHVPAAPLAVDALNPADIAAVPRSVNAAVTPTRRAWLEIADRSTLALAGLIRVTAIP